MYSNYISEAEIIIPKRVSPDGSHLSHNLTTFHDDDEAPVHFNITLDSEEHILILHPATHFLASHAIIERHKRDVHTRLKLKPQSRNCHYQGKVYGQSYSTVAISACNGLVNRLQIKFFFHTTIVIITEGGDDTYKKREVLDRTLSPWNAENRTRTQTSYL